MSRLYLIAGLVAILALAVPLTHLMAKKPPLGQTAIPGDVLQAFASWTFKYQKTYLTPAEKEFRLKAFYRNFVTIQAHNSNPRKTYTMGLNLWADTTPEEFQAKLATKSQSPLETAEATEQVAEEPKALGQQINFDWISCLQQRTITGSSTCNDNYAWVGAVVQNADYYIAQGSPISYSFSPQTYIDCSSNFGNSGCNGGWAVNTFLYSQQWGIDTMNNYPYYGTQRPCRAATGYFKNAGVYKVQSLSNTDLYNKLSSKKVIASAIDISSAQFYTGGVFTGPCTVKVNQGVILVGAGVDTASTLAYWLLLNTWGSFWGENGYMRIARFTVDGNQQYSSCGLNMNASYPTF